MVPFIQEREPKLYGSSIAIALDTLSVNRQTPKIGRRLRSACENACRRETREFLRLFATASNCPSANGPGFFLENYSKPPIRDQKTHEANERAVLHLKRVLGQMKLAEITSDAIELYLRHRLQQRVRVRTKEGFVERDKLKRLPFIKNCGFCGGC